MRYFYIFILTLILISCNDKKGYGGVKVDKISTQQLNNSKIQINDVITHINNNPIFNVEDFEKKIKSLKENSLANLLVYRDSSPVYLAIKISK